MIIYIDGIFDLFHRGHLESFKQIKDIYKDCFLIVGVVSDEDAMSYKREPIISYEDRCEIIKSIKYVDKVIIGFDNLKQFKKVEFSEKKLPKTNITKVALIKLAVISPSAVQIQFRTP